MKVLKSQGVVEIIRVEIRKANHTCLLFRLFLKGMREDYESVVFLSGNFLRRLLNE